jgi:hypothetical protein
MFRPWCLSALELEWEKTTGAVDSSIASMVV